MRGLASLDLVRVGSPNMVSHTGTLLAGKLLHTGQIDKMISSFIGGCVLLYHPPRSDCDCSSFLGISTLSSSISRARYPSNSYHRAPSPNAYAHTPRGYPRFSHPLARLLRWRRVRYLSATTKAVYPKVLKSPGLARNIASSMGEDTSSNMPLRVTLLS